MANLNADPVGKVPFWLPQRGTTDVLDSPPNYLREKGTLLPAVRDVLRSHKMSFASVHLPTGQESCTVCYRRFDICMGEIPGTIYLWRARTSGLGLGLGLLKTLVSSDHANRSYMMDEQLGNHSMFVGRKYHTAGCRTRGRMLLLGFYQERHITRLIL